LHNNGNLESGPLEVVAAAHRRFRFSVRAVWIALIQTGSYCPASDNAADNQRQQLACLHTAAGGADAGGTAAHLPRVIMPAATAAP